MNIKNVIKENFPKGRKKKLTLYFVRVHNPPRKINP